MNTPITLIRVGRWTCYAHVLEPCELCNHLYAAADLPLHVTDLWRVVTEVPESQWSEHWRLDDSGALVFDVKVLRPVRTEFSFRFPLPQFAEFLEDVNFYNDMLVCDQGHEENAPRIAYWSDIGDFQILERLLISQGVPLRDWHLGDDDLGLAVS